MPPSLEVADHPQQLDKKLSYSQLASINTSTVEKTSKTPATVIPGQLQVPQKKTPTMVHEEQMKRELCVFAVTGKCRYGHLCRNLHGLQCPRCLLYCLHPFDLEQNEAHIEECFSKPACQKSSAEDEIECGICLERVADKPDPRFGLLNCDHAFCLACIRQWRGATSPTATPEHTRSCPLCRTVTYFIVPSSRFITDPDEKQKVIEAYKRKVQNIPCRHFDNGYGTCPFGSSCFYSHQLPDGTHVPPESLIPKSRSYYDANEQVKVVREFRLGDFLPPSS